MQKGSSMSQLDDALVELRDNMDSPKAQSKYYDLFLNTSFFVPTFQEAADGEVPEGQVAPLVLEADGNDYLMLFDSIERLNAWAKTEAAYVEVPGHVLAATSRSPLHWALNVETEFSKPFIPSEIEWLRNAVELCNAQAAKQEPA
jgi:hypothetical protein